MNLFKREPDVFPTDEEVDALNEFIAKSPEKYKKVKAKRGMTLKSFNKSLKRVRK